MDAPLVSIVTTCFNHDRFLGDYFQGLLSQTYKPLELILVDDCSTDGSWDLIRSFEPQLQSAFAAVKCVRNSKNAGVFVALNLACGMASGKYISFLESDDYYLPTRIEEGVEYLESHPQVGLVHSDTDYIVGEEVELSHWAKSGWSIATGYVFEKLLENNFIMTCSICCRTELLRCFVDLLRYKKLGYLMADYPLCLDLARNTKFGYIDKSLARYRVLQESASHSVSPLKELRFWKSYYQIKCDYASMASMPSVTKNAILEMMLRSALDQATEAIRDGQGKIARGYLQFLINENPSSFFDRRVLVRWLESLLSNRSPILQKTS